MVEKQSGRSWTTSPMLKLCGFVLLLGVVLGVGALAGAAFGPEPEPEPSASDEPAAVPGESSGDGSSATPSSMSTVGEYVVTLDGDLVAGATSEITLTVSLGGEPVVDLDPYLGAHGHLVAIREGDLAYLHIQSLDDTADPGGPTVRFAVEVPSAGTYRLFFDFSHDGTVRTAEMTAIAGAGDSPAGDGPAHGHEE